MSELSAVSVGFSRPGREILAGVDFVGRAGSFVGLIGPNGAGKSSLLDILAGLRRPTAGKVSLDDRLLQDWSPQDLARHRAYLPQHPICEWPISVARLVALGLTPALPAFGRLPAILADRVDDTLEAFDLLPQRDQPATTLSGGELSRAMLARVMVGNPRILIVDEPFAGLDPRHAMAAATRLAAYAAAGNLVIAAMHELDLALDFTTSLLALRNGSVLAQGPIATTLTARLVEALFDVPAELHRSEHGAWVRFRRPDR